MSIVFKATKREKEYHILNQLLLFQIKKNYIDFIKLVGTRFAAQAQDVWDPGPMNPVQ